MTSRVNASGVKIASWLSAYQSDEKWELDLRTNDCVEFFVYLVINGERVLKEGPFTEREGHALMDVFDTAKECRPAS